MVVMPAADGEPVFVLRAQDALSLAGIRAYRKACERAGLAGQAREVGRAFTEFEEWQAANMGAVKLPDHRHVPVAGQAGET